LSQTSRAQRSEHVSAGFKSARSRFRFSDIFHPVWLTSFEHTPEFHFWTFWFLFIRFTSDPTDAKTDGDQLDDAEERKLHTNPRDEQTYTIVENQTARIRNLTTGQNTSNLTYMTQMGVDASLAAGTDYPNIELTDATADFDFVRTDEPGLDQFTFLALDGQPRTDTWVPNQAELTADTDPWHPDTDNDGLTDGQEARWLTLLAETAEDPTSVEVTPAAPRSSPQSRCQGSGATFYECPTVGELGTEPTTADSDDDDYWDGWFGVYGVDRANASNHILYRHHLQTGDGIERDEILQFQTGIHQEGNIPSAVGADIDDDHTDEHSNIHIGERHWGTSPTDENDTPELGITVEADFLEGQAEQRFKSEDWTEEIEQFYGLYGISLRMNIDDTIDQTPSSFYTTFRPAVNLADQVDDEPSDLHLLAINDPAFGFFFQDSTGVNLDAIVDTMEETGTTCRLPQEFTLRNPDDHFIFTEGINEEANARPGPDPVDVTRSPYTSPTRLVGGLTEIHEIAHSFRIGEDDDSEIDPLPCGEVYSGSGVDDTPERIEDPSSGNLDTGWSIMRRGYGSNSLRVDNGTTHFTFSLEELLTIEQPDE